MDSKTQDDLAVIHPSSYNFQIRFNNVVYRAFFVKKIISYYSESFEDFVKNKSILLYCAPFNSTKDCLMTGGFLIKVPMRERRFISEWDVEQWIEFVRISYNKEKKQDELNNITEALFNSPSHSKDLRKLAKEKTKNLKNSIKELDKRLESFYVDARGKNLENALFNG